MLYELRRYGAPTMRHPAPLVHFLGERLVPGLRAAGVDVVGCFTTIIGPQPCVSLLLAFPDANAWQEHTAGFASSSDWQAMEPGLFPDGRSLITGYQTILLRPTPFATDLAASLHAAQPGVFEERIYHAVHSRAYARLAERFANGTMGVFSRLGMHPIGPWEVLAGLRQPALFYLMRHNSLDEWAPQWAAYGADPARAAISAAAETDGPIIASSDTAILRPTSFSPLR